MARRAGTRNPTSITAAGGINLTTPAMINVTAPAGVNLLAGTSINGLTSNDSWFKAIAYGVTGVVTDPETQVETVESTEAWNVLTTQFHPELMMDADPRFAALTETVARRAHVFRLEKRLAAEGKSSCADLLAAMREAPEGRFLPTDFAWVEQALAPRQNQ